MYFYVDHTSRFERNTGVQRCVRSIATALIDLGIPLRPVLWDWTDGGFLPATEDRLEHLSRWNGPAVDAWAPTTFEPAQRCHPSDAWLMIVELVSGADQLRWAADEVGLKVCWLFHDAIPVRWSHLYMERAESMRDGHFVYMDGFAQFEAVVSNSRTTGEHLREHLQQRQLRYDHVQPLPLAEDFAGVNRLPPPIPHRDPSQPWQLLCVGSLELRKNHMALFKALAWLKALQRLPPHALTLVGWAKDPVVVEHCHRACAAGVRVRWECDADDAQLLELYGQSDFTVYPSLEEGFGLPVAESLWHRRICLCSDDGALGEISRQGGCALVNSHDWRSIAAALERLFHDDAWRDQLQQQVEQRSFRSWRTYATELLHTLHCPLEAAAS